MSSSEDVVVRLDQELGQILLEDPSIEARLAPSLRGVDLAAVGAVVLVVAGSSADTITLVLAGAKLRYAARRLVDAVRARGGSPDRGSSLNVDLRSGSTTMRLDLRSESDEALAQALRQLSGLLGRDDDDPGSAGDGAHDE